MSPLVLCVYLLKTGLRLANDREGGAWKGSTNDNRFSVIQALAGTTHELYDQLDFLETSPLWSLAQGQ